MSGVNKGLLAMLAGVGTGAGMPEESPAGMFPFWKRKLLTNYYTLDMDSFGHRLDDNSKRSLVAYLEPQAWEQFHFLYPDQLNKIYMSPHELVSRSGQWIVGKTLQNIQRTLSDPYALRKPTWSKKPNNSPHGLLSERLGPFYVPLSPWEDGFYAHTLIKPTDRQLRLIAEAEAKEAEGGGPTPMSGRGFLAIPPISQLSPIVSDVASQPASDASVAGGGVPVKEKSQALRQLGLGTRALMEGAGSALSLGLTDPGRVVADWVGLPSPVAGTPEALTSSIVRGGADGLSYMLPGTAVARKALSPAVRSFGAALAGSPRTDMAVGSSMGLLDYMLQSAGDKRQN